MISVLIRPFTVSHLVNSVTELFKDKEVGNIDQKQAVKSNKQQFSGVHVLVAEDNEVNQILITELLSNWGIAVTLAQNGAECLALLKAQKQSFDLIFMDVQMPVMDGLDATRHIRQDMQLTDIPIVALTANVMADDQQKFAQVGMNAFLGKPFDLEELNQILHRFVGNRNL